MTWRPTDITAVEIVQDASAGDIVTIRVMTPVGWVYVMGELDIDGRVLLVREAHIHSDAGSKAFGPTKLRVIATAVLERIDCDEARVEGAARTTGARPGHKPRPLRFSR